MNYPRLIAAVVVSAWPALALGQAYLEELPYQWTCKPLGYYGIDVAPNGTYKTIAEALSGGPFVIGIRKRADADKKPPQTLADFDAQYIISFTGKEAGIFQHEDSDFDNSIVQLSYSKRNLTGVIGTYFNGRPTTVSLAPADKDWMFSVQSGSLTTDLQARHNNILFPPNIPKSTPSSDIFMMTGPCIRDR